MTLFTNSNKPVKAAEDITVYILMYYSKKDYCYQTMDERINIPSLIINGVAPFKPVGSVNIHTCDDASFIDSGVIVVMKDFELAARQALYHGCSLFRCKIPKDSIYYVGGPKRSNGEYAATEIFFEKKISTLFLKILKFFHQI